MRIRDTTWKDYGMTKKDRRIVDKFCGNPSDEHLIIIREAIDSTNKIISEELFNSLVHKKSYVKQSMKKYIPIGEKDFYGYRRKVIYKIYNMIILLGLK